MNFQRYALEILLFITEGIFLYLLNFIIAQ